jgi:N-ethylmaleimide reductase
MNSKLFSPFKLGRIEIQNSVVMAPMTRSRAIGNVPNDLMAKYYGQRSSAGLIITEGTSPSANGLGYARIPGLFNSEQVQGWKKSTQAAHSGGAKIFIQLMHAGRVSHPLNLPAGAKVLAPSAIANPGQVWTDQEGMQNHPVPEAMSESEILSAIQEYADSAKLAIEAGFDGVELHSANGYLMDQFLNTASNQRQDRFGGSVENRMRFVLEVAKASVAAIGGDRVGIRISPYGVFNGMQADAEMDELYTRLSQELSKLGLIYIHVVDHSSMGAPEVSDGIKTKIRAAFKGTYILSGGYDLKRAEEDLAAGKGELVAFGRPFISNPDLVQKLKTGAELKPANPDTFYTPGEAGYTDYSL